MDWKPNLPALDSLKPSIYAIKAHMVPNYGFFFKRRAVWYVIKVNRLMRVQKNK